MLGLPSVGSDKKIYWIKRGLSEKESNLKRVIKKIRRYSEVAAKEKSRHRQNTISLSKYVKRYGDELGLIKYKKRIDEISYTSS